jgi:hypothetical protein
MTRVYDKSPDGGCTRLLILGAAAYPDARQAKLRVPKLKEISSAAMSALYFARHAIEDWEGKFPKPLGTVDLLANDLNVPNGVNFVTPEGHFALDPPTMTNAKAARKDWMKNARAEDVLIFYCCGHGIWLPATGRTFLTASFGSDEDNPWSDAIALDDFALALGEHPARQQWLIFDCCNNTPPEALKAMRARAEPLLASAEGQRKFMENTHGMLSQVTVASSSPGSESFGKDGRPSRFMEAFLEACGGSGCRREVDGLWWVDQQGIDDAISTYNLRIAPIEEEAYFIFPRVTQTDAAEAPRFLGLPGRPKCTLVVTSEPPHRLRDAELTIKCRPTAKIVGGQKAGKQAQARFRLSVSSWLEYDLEAALTSGAVSKGAFAIPPVAKTVFVLKDLQSNG